MKVGFGPGHIVLDGDPGPLPKRGRPPIFGPCLLWPNGWVDQDATWYTVRPWPRPHCVRWGFSSPAKGAQQPPPLFSAHVNCGDGRPSQLLLSSCLFLQDKVTSSAKFYEYSYKTFCVTQSERATNTATRKMTSLDTERCVE